MNFPKGKQEPQDVAATITVTKSVLLRGAGDEDTESAELEVRTFETTPAMVGVSCERTVNTGNYSSLKMRVEIVVPCYVEEVAETHMDLSKRVPRRVDKLVEEWLAKHDCKVQN